MKGKLAPFAKGMMLLVGELWTLNGPVPNSVTSWVAAEPGHTMSSQDGAIQKLLHLAQDMPVSGSGSQRVAAQREVIILILLWHLLHFILMCNCNITECTSYTLTHSLLNFDFFSRWWGNSGEKVDDNIIHNGSILQDILWIVHKLFYWSKSPA